MTSTLFNWVARTVTVAGLSSTCWAGGHGGPMFRPGGFHAGGAAPMGRAMPPVAGTWHVRGNQGYVTRFGQAGPAFGHTSTGFGFGRPNANSLYGHTNTADAGRPGRVGVFGHTQTSYGLGRTRYGAWGRRPYAVFPSARVRYGYGYGRAGTTGYGPVLTGGGYGFSYGGTSPALAGGVTGGYGYGGGYVETPLASQYSEPPLNRGNGGGPELYGDGSYPAAGTGGPGVLMVNNNDDSGCTCGRGRTHSPVVYRFGVGSYY